MKEIIFDEEKINQALELIKEIQKDLYHADCLLYDGVMKTAYAKGMEYVTYENPKINMQMPEKYMIQCRDTTNYIEKTIRTNTDYIKNYYLKEKTEN